MKLCYPKPLLFAALLFAAVSFGSCLKSDHVENVPAAYVSFIHSAPKTSALDVELDPNRLWLNNFNYLNHTYYRRAIPGNRTIKVFQAISAAKTPIFSVSHDFVADKSYSVFIVDTASKMTAVVLRDSTRKAEGDSARIRFANMIPDVSAVDFYVQGRTAPVATNIAYKSAVNFMSIKAEPDVVFEVRQAGTSTVLATSQKLNIGTGRIYTFWSSGFKNLTDNGKVVIDGMLHL